MKKIVLALALSALIMSGCVNALEMTALQQAQMVEYSADLLLKYARGYDYGLVAIEIPEPEVVVVPDPLPPDVPTDDDTGGTGADDINTPEIIDNTQPQFNDMNEMVGVEGLAFNYSQYLLTDEYPTAVTPGDVYFFVGASPQSKLLAVEFEVTNISGEDIYLNMLDKMLRIRMVYTNTGTGVEHVENAMITMLPNDLSLFQDYVPAGGTLTLVSMCEILEQDADAISNLEYRARSDEGELIIYLW